jgi:hypothetical protein
MLVLMSPEERGMTMQKTGTVRAEIAGHGQFETRGTSLDALIDRFWNMSREELNDEIHERVGDCDKIAFTTEGMSKIELLLIIAELSGLATN